VELLLSLAYKYLGVTVVGTPSGSGGAQDLQQLLTKVLPVAVAVALVVAAWSSLAAVRVLSPLFGLTLFRTRWAPQVGHALHILTAVAPLRLVQEEDKLLLRAIVGNPHLPLAKAACRCLLGVEGLQARMTKARMWFLLDTLLHDPQTQVRRQM
jgi:hypothetical protein